jgi:hypothetical protein
LDLTYLILAPHFEHAMQPFLIYGFVSTSFFVDGEKSTYLMTHNGFLDQKILEEKLFLVFFFLLFLSVEQLRYLKGRNHSTCVFAD